MTVAMSCPDRASLERLLDHGAGPDEVERLAGHLETCGRCGETVETLLAADRNAAALRGTKVEADAPSVQLLRARLANLRAAPASQDTTTGGNTRGAAPSSASAPFEATKDKSVSLAPPQQPDEIGRLGGYRILKELGRGGMGVVYQAEDPKLKRLVALKAMLPGLAADDAARQRFLREAQAMAAVHHDHVVTIHAVDEANGVPFLAMEFLQGMPMDQWLKGGRKPSIAQLLRLGREIAEGLAAAHERGLIHRDIKPGNIWLDSSHKGRVKILDFGLARSGQEDVHLTRTGAIVGTPAYMAPEQARGEKVDARGDLFSLGCVLYRLCTGTMPFAGNTTTALLMALALDTPKSVRDLNSDVPPELADLVTRLLEKEPAKRPQSAREVIQALQAVTRASASAVSTATVSAVIPPAPTPAKSAPGGRKRRPWIVAAVAAGFLATAIAVAIVVIIRDKNGDIVATINAPPGGSVDIHDEAKKNGQAAAPKPTVDDAWVKQVAALPAEQQVDAVAAKLKELNPGFDGKVKPTIEGGGVVGLEFVTDNVTDISPLRALPELKSLNCRGSADVWNGRLADLSPLKGMALTALECGRTRVSDLSPVKGMPLKEIWCDFKPERDAELLRSITTLEKINGKPAADFWKDVEAQQTAFDAWLKQVAALPADKQAEAVTAKLKELNPGFDGKVTPTIENGVVVGLLFVTDNLTDVSPVRALTGLQGLTCSGSNYGKGKLADLSPLMDMKLTYLDCSRTPVSDLSPLKGMPLTYLNCDGAPVSDLSPLKGMPLTTLWCGGPKVSDLSPLKGMPLTFLGIPCTQVSDLTPLKNMKLTSLNCMNTPVSDLSPLKGMKLTSLNCMNTPVSDLSPLKGMPLTTLWCGGAKVFDLSPLKGMPLTDMNCERTKVSDLSLLKGMPLTVLNCCGTKVSDLSPLKGMPLTVLNCERTKVSDLAPLTGAPLKTLRCNFKPERDAEILRSNKTLEMINGKPAAEFWKAVGAAAKPPVEDAWVKQVAALPADKQVEAVAAELKARNPGFDGKITPTFENGVVVGLEFASDEVTDIAPLRALAGLRTLKCDGSGEGTGWLSDLSPLKDMKLTTLDCCHTKVSDLSPLKDMKLTSLAFWDTQVSDLSPLKNMKLTLMDCGMTAVFDLSPLKGMPLTFLHCDLTQVSDLSPLMGMPLKDLKCDFEPERDADILRSIKTLEWINGKPAAEFWKDVDGKKP